MAKMMEDGVTILFVSHSAAQVRKVCKNAIWLDHGKMIKAGPADEISKAYEKFCKE